MTIAVDPLIWAEATGYSAGMLGKPVTSCGLTDEAAIARWVGGYLRGRRSAKAAGRPAPACALITRAGAHWLAVEYALLDQAVGTIARAELAALLERPAGAVKVEACRRGLLPARPSARNGRDAQRPKRHRATDRMTP